jgi:hypothetical protein
MKKSAVEQEFIAQQPIPIGPSSAIEAPGPGRTPVARKLPTERLAKLL